MRKQYEKPQAEKIEFNYTDVVVASSGSLKAGADLNGCYKGANANPNKNCEPQYR